MSEPPRDHFPEEIDRIKGLMANHRGPEDSPIVVAIRSLIDVAERLGKAQDRIEARSSPAALVDAAKQAGRQGFAIAAKEVVRGWTWRRWSYVISACAIVCACVSLVSYRIGISAANVPAATDRATVQLAAYVSAWCAERGHLVSERDGIFCPVKFPMQSEAKR